MTQSGTTATVGHMKFIATRSRVWIALLLRKVATVLDGSVENGRNLPMIERPWDSSLGRFARSPERPTSS